VNGQTYHIAFVGKKGDEQYHQKCGILTRTYSNLGNDGNIPMCRHCMAGSVGMPFEDISTNAAWKATLYTVRPFDPANMSELEAIPYDQHDTRPEAKYMWDFFHATKQGNCSGLNVYLYFCILSLAFR